MTKIFLKEKAQELRKKGKSIGVIANQLKISKSTASYWCKNISLSEKQIFKLYNDAQEISLRGLMLAAERKRQERIKSTILYNQMGAKDVGIINNRDLLILGLGLYWGEGYKSGNDELAFTNSDPGMIKILIVWLQKIYGIDKSKLICRVSINQVHQTRSDKIIKYWVNVTGISSTQFTKTSFIKAKVKKNYKNSENYFGVLRVKVRNGTNLRRRILGSIAKLGS